MAKKETWWQRTGNAAQIASALVSACGFVLVLFQINELRQNGRANSARQTYLGFMDMAFKNPSFTVADYEKIKAGGKEELARYEIFVDYFLYSCEEAMASLESKQKEWHDSCLVDIKPHLPFICEKLKIEPDYLSTYSQATQDLVKLGMQRYAVMPDCKMGKA